MKKLLLLLLLPLSVLADDFDGSFTAPTERTDNTSLSIDQIDGYIVYVNGVEQPGLIPASETTFVVTITESGDHDINIRTIDSDGRPSAMSNTITRSVSASPKAPVLLEINLRLN